MKLIRLAKNIAFDLRYGAFLGGQIPTRYADAGAANVANSDYAILPYLFDRRIEQGDVLVDVGCGKGRVLNWWLRFYGHNQIIGIELDRKVADNTRRRLRRYPKVAVYCGDVLDIFPEKGTLFYLFNPFDRAVMARFIDVFIERRPPNCLMPRRILYYNCVWQDLFTDDARFRTQFLAPYGTGHPALIAMEIP